MLKGFNFQKIAVRGLACIFALCISFLGGFLDINFGEGEKSNNIIKTSFTLSGFGFGGIGDNRNIEESVLAPLRWQPTNSGGIEDKYNIAGVDLAWQADVKDNWPEDLENLMISIAVYALDGQGASKAVPFEIVSNAFKSGSVKNQGLIFKELEFKKAWDWHDYKEGDILSYLTVIGDNAFEGGAFKVADMSGMQLLNSIGEYAFYNAKSLTTVDLSNSGIKTVGNWAFAGCSDLYYLNLDGCQEVTINQRAFENCTGLTALDFKKSGVVSIGANAFGACTGLIQIDFGSAPITMIGENAFNNTGIESLDLTGLTQLSEIKSQAFANCQRLKSVKMGYVPNVSANIFNLCSSLESIIFDSEDTYERYKSAGTFSSLSVTLSYDKIDELPKDPQPDPDSDFPGWVIALIIIVAVTAAGAAAFLILKKKGKILSGKNRGTKAPRESRTANGAEAVSEIAAAAEGAAAADEPLPLPSTLTRRELEVAQMMLAGIKRKEIAETLFISENTIKTHINKILDKTECADQLGFVVKYGKNGKG